MSAVEPLPLGLFLAAGGNPRRELAGRWCQFLAEIPVELDAIHTLCEPDLERRVLVHRAGARALCGEPGLEDVWPPGTLDEPDWSLAELATLEAWLADVVEQPGVLEQLQPWIKPADRMRARWR